MMRRPRWQFVVALIVGGLGGVWGWTQGHPQTQERVFHVTARRYAFDPPIIRVNRGDHVTIYLKSKDVTHGFFLEGHDLDAQISPDEKPKMRHPSQGDDFQEVEAITFTANRAGKFRYRCSKTCGSLHPFMQGELIVGPNRLYHLGVGLVVLTALLAWWRGRPGAAPQPAAEEHSPAQEKD